MAEYENGRSTSSRDALYRRVLLFVCTVSHIPPYVFLSREDDDDVRDFGKHDFRSVLLRAMLSNANSLTTPVMQVKSRQKTSSGLGNITCALFAVHLTLVYSSSSCLLVNWSHVKRSKIVFFALIVL